MSTTKKHDVFVSVPMRHKSVNEVPGIGKALGDRCIENNISQVLSGMAARRFVYIFKKLNWQTFQTWCIFCFILFR